MTPEEVAARFDNRPGYRLVDYGLVGLPVFKVTAIGTVLEKKELGPIEEFVLRVVRFGLSEATEIAAFLGLSERIVDSVLSGMIQRELLRARSEGHHTRFLLTSKGEAIAQSQEEIRPTEAVLVFTYDGIVRKPRYYGDSQLFTARELRNRGIPELRGAPDRGPELQELDLQAVSEVLRLTYAVTEVEDALLRICSVEKRLRLYCEAVALAFRSGDGSTLQVAFAIDGRLSEPHELAFADRGVDRNDLFAPLLVPAATNPTLEIAPDIQARLARPDVAHGRASIAHARARLLAAEADHQRSLDTDKEPKSEEAVAAAKREMAMALSATGLTEVRFVEVYEHPDILKRALADAKRRLLIVSPWIRASVVDREFLGQLAKLLSRGVAVFIGYGIAANDDKESIEDVLARKQLHEMAEQNATLVVTRLGDTHAKVLIVDSDFCVITSFNWLSFRGDRARKFREEYGTYIAIPRRVDELFAQLQRRLMPPSPAGNA